jgi:hypothetical protein
MKLDWEPHSGNNALWCRVMEGKYNRANTEAEAKSLWKTLVRVWPNYVQFDHRSIGNGRDRLACAS